LAYIYSTIMKRFVKWMGRTAAIFLLPLGLMAQSPAATAANTAGGTEKNKDPEARFRHMDKNGDGFVTADESQSPERFQRLVQKADNSPKDGKISKDEFMKLRAKGGQRREHDADKAAQDTSSSNDAGQGSGRQNPEARFQRMDKNSDGVLTADEARDPDRFKQLQTRADTNKDGKISKEEFLKAGGPPRRGQGVHSQAQSAPAATVPASSPSPSLSPK
jgi:Ca2+-binding EF-hand superfamily protein